MSGDAATITHVAGLDVLFQGRWQRQRCAWCGAVLVDNDLSLVAVPIPADESEPEPPALWPMGALVRVADLGGGARCTSVLDDTDVPPDDSCMVLDPAVTS